MSAPNPSPVGAWRATVLTLFPEMFPGPLGQSIAGKALATGHWALHSLSHLIDTNHATGTWVGWLEAAGLVLTTVLLAIALRISMSDQKFNVEAGEP